MLAVGREPSGENCGKHCKVSCTSNPDACPQRRIFDASRLLILHHAHRKASGSAARAFAFRSASLSLWESPQYQSSMLHRFRLTGF
jgi:hypothetical protein